MEGEAVKYIEFEDVSSITTLKLPPFVTRTLRGREVLSPPCAASLKHIVMAECDLPFQFYFLLGEESSLPALSISYCSWFMFQAVVPRSLCRNWP